VVQIVVPLAVVLAPCWAFAEQPAEQPTIDTKSVSCGRVNRGGLAAAVALEAEGPGYLIPEPWRTRGVRYGTAELVGMVRRAAAAVAREHPGARLGVADLSRQHGGSAPQHRSHQAGRDVDLIYFALDDAKVPVAPGGCMPAYGPDRRASCCHYPQKRDVTPRRFDVARNWALVRAMLTDQHARVRVIFMSLGIRKWLLEHAARVGEPRALIRRAEMTLMRPPGGRAHTDHMHVRVACTLDDRRRGRCRNDPDLRGRWFGRIRCPRRVVPAPAR
jgi:penicillin-insensitive murein DD-endopeptidase